MDIGVYVFLIVITMGFMVMDGILIQRLNEEIKDREELEIMCYNHENDTNINMIDYSERILDFIKEFSIELCVIKFRGFADNHDMEKVTKVHLENLIQECAKEVNNSLVEGAINYDHLLYNKEFIDNYIIQTVMIAMKDLLNKSIEEE